MQKSRISIIRRNSESAKQEKAPDAKPKRPGSTRGSFTGAQIGQTDARPNGAWKGESSGEGKAAGMKGDVTADESTVSGVGNGTADIISGRYHVQSATATTTASHRLKDPSGLPASRSSTSSSLSSSFKRSNGKSSAKNASSRSIVSPETQVHPAGVLARRVHAACGWIGCTPDVEELRQLHAHYDDEIVQLQYADSLWVKVILSTA